MGQLKVAWTFRTGALDEKRDLNEKATFETTPILVDGKLYLTTPWGQVLRSIRRRERKFWGSSIRTWICCAATRRATNRGVSIWHDAKGSAGLCVRCVDFYRGRSARKLIALDGATRKTLRGFRESTGKIDLTRDVELRDVWATIK